MGRLFCLLLNISCSSLLNYSTGGSLLETANNVCYLCGLRLLTAMNNIYVEYNLLILMVKLHRLCTNPEQKLK